MSSALYIYQGHVNMGSWGSSSPIYRASFAPYDSDKEYGETFDPLRQFPRMIEALQQDIQEHEEHLRVVERVLNGTLSYEDRYDAADSYEAICQDIQKIKDQIVIVRFLLSIAEDNSYASAQAEWTWMKG